MDTLAPWENLAKGYNVDLKTLFSTPQHFNENKKAFNEFDTEWKKKIRNQEDYYNQLQAEQLKQNQLAEERNRLAQLERERQEALRRQPVISAPSVTPQVNKQIDTALNKREDLWDYFNWANKIFNKQIPLPPNLPSGSPIATGAPIYNIGRWIAPTPGGYQPVTQASLYEAYNKNPNLPFNVQPPSNWRKMYGV